MHNTLGLYLSNCDYYNNISNISQQSIDRLNYGAKIVWVEVEKDEKGFLSFVDEVLTVLESPELPERSLTRQWCEYINTLS